MKLSTLKKYLLSLTEPLSDLGSNSQVVDELRRAAKVLDQIGELDLYQFVDLVQQAKEYRVNRELHIPPHLNAVIAAYDKLRGLKTRSTAPEVDQEELNRKMHAIDLNALDKDTLAHLAVDLGFAVKTKPTKNDVIETIWIGITGAVKPGKRTTTKATPKTAGTEVKEYAQKINALKERANCFDSTRQEIEQGLRELNLAKLSNSNLITLAREVHCGVSAKAKKDQIIKGIERVVLLVKENLLGAFH
ncbi:MAG: hypothetical protein EBV06_03100 [Planctomycetia bacterium]|nr:hypothetical protein [Planctomycetia bacterium]